MKYKFRYYKEVKYVAPGNPAPAGFMRCGTCNRAWDDSKSTELTPVPAGRCPFEYMHKDNGDIGAREREPGEKFYRWTVQVEVDAIWVADGFNLTAERMHEMLSRYLCSAEGHELRAKIIKAPDPGDIRREQGAKE